jgi:hypothetical protein
MSKIEQHVMASVAAIYAVRKLTGATALKCYTFVLSLIGVSFFVSLPHVAQNFEHVMNGGVGSAAFFVLSAVLGTTLIVQLALILGVAALASLAADFMKTGRPATA